jgi:L-alanine-DL-glutamate epimerase-like enolase superfamily enzyme
VGDDIRRITSVAVWEGSSGAAAPIRWSELAPPVVARQTIVSVAVSGPDGRTAGCASLTTYVPPDAGDDDRPLPLAGWLGAPVVGPASELEAANPYDPGGTPLGAVVQLAALDALGRATDLPAAAFLGGIRRTRLEAYASLPSFGDPDAAVACASAAVGAGFRAVKFHASGWRDVDVETIAAARRMLGAPITLMWDASCAYDLYTAVAVGRALGDAEFAWFEAPFADDATGSLRLLAARTEVPLVPDGLVQRSPAEWVRDVRDGIWGALRLDVTRAPDVGAAMRLVRLAEALGVPCEIQSFGFPLGQYANLQLALTTPACRFFEVPFPVDDFVDVVAAAPAVADGFAHLPGAPGLGHGVDVDELEARLPSIVEVSL